MKALKQVRTIKQCVLCGTLYTERTRGQNASIFNIEVGAFANAQKC
jgi:hypothetical protein